MGGRVARLLRRLVPSVPVLSRSPLTALLDGADAIVKRRHPEWSRLPPASLRMRIGVGNFILFNHAAFVAQANELVGELARRRILAPDSHVLEIGCGCGRNAAALASYLGPAGSYVGQDVDAEMIAWCAKNLASERFRFEHVNQFSRVYNPKGSVVEGYRFPAGDGRISCIIAVSVFSHLLYRDARHYLRESSRVLSEGGLLHSTWFLMDYIRPRLGERWTFGHRDDQCYLENRRYPEAAVAYDLDVVKGLLAENHLELQEVYHEERHQQTIVARKRAL
jgi:cyclopropane fatty-acyl-phospholipid synthase-like methyltransferase